MEQQPLISVVIPSYNRAEKLPACIRSVLKQSYSELEILLVDDGSTDHTAAVAASIDDPRLHYYRLSENRGACHARNCGALLARGSLLAFQDSDDTWRPDKLARQLAFLRRTGADMVFCAMRRIPSAGRPFTFPVHGFHPRGALEEMLTENRASTQTMLMYRRVWEQLRFDEQLRRYQDWDFSIRAAERFALAYQPEILADSPVNAESISVRVASYGALQQLWQKHEALYRQHPRAAAAMQLRLGKRLAHTDPLAAAAHFQSSFRLRPGLYALGWRLFCQFRFSIPQEESS